MSTARPLTVEHDWPRLYREFPEVYDAFGSFPYDPPWIEVVNRKFPLAGQTVVDTGAGTGKSTVELARYAKRVLGVEPEDAMRRLADERTRELGLTNVSILAGDAAHLPIEDSSADAVISITGYLDVDEATRVLRPGGLMLRLDITPGWYGGDLNRVIGHPTPELERESRRYVEEQGFSYEDYDSIQEYGSTENVVSTYGFIFGQRAIDHLKETGNTSIHWRFRLHYRYRAAA